MALRGPEKGPFKLLEIGLAHAEFGELEAKQIQNMRDPRKNRDGMNFDGAAGEDRRHDALPDGEVLDQGRVPRKARLHFFE